jgi:hypothetical protein
MFQTVTEFPEFEEWLELVGVATGVVKAVGDEDEMESLGKGDCDYCDRARFETKLSGPRSHSMYSI